MLPYITIVPLGPTGREHITDFRVAFEEIPQNLLLQFRSLPFSVNTFVEWFQRQFKSTRCHYPNFTYAFLMLILWSWPVSQ